MFVKLEDNFEELVAAIMSKKEVEHMIVRYILDMEAERWSIMDFGSNYIELGYELGLETDGNGNVVFLDVIVVQLQ